MEEGVKAEVNNRIGNILEAYKMGLISFSEAQYRMMEVFEACSSVPPTPFYS